MRIVTAAALAVVGVAALVATSVPGSASAAADAARPAGSTGLISSALTDITCRTSANCLAGRPPRSGTAGPGPPPRSARPARAWAANSTA